MAKYYHINAILPINIINDELGLNLINAGVVISPLADQHIYEKHYQDYQIIMANLPEIATNPDYMGLDNKHPKNFVLIKQITNADNILIAISIETINGFYRIKTAYRVNNKFINNRLKSGKIKPIKKAPD